VSEVISVRVRRELKRGLEELGIDYAEEIRRFLEELVARERLRRVLDRARALRRELEGEVGLLPSSAELISAEDCVAAMSGSLSGSSSPRGRCRPG
jgi:hypothetical protein